MARLENATAATVIGVAGFQLAQLWNNNAPSLSDIRNAHSSDLTIKQQLLDADVMVGGIAIILGVTFAILTGDMTALLVMLAIFGSMSLWHHSVLNAQPV